MRNIFGIMIPFVLGIGVFSAVGGLLAQPADPSPLAGTRWQLVEMNGAVEPFVTLTFDDQGRVSGNGGCNRYGGGYSTEGDSIRFTNLFSTMMACPHLEVERAFFTALGSASTFELRDDSLIIRYGAAGEALVFGPAPTLEGSMWQLAAIDGAPAADGALVTLLFAEDGSLVGDSGCNRYRSSYSADADAGTLMIEPVLSTRRACLSEELSAQEAALLTGLEAAARYSLRPDRLIITTAQGQRLEFTPHNPLAGTAWTLTTINGAAPLANVAITLAFADENLSGSDGCNQYSGAYRVTVTSLRIGPNLVSTLRACPSEIMDQARVYLGALIAATGYSLSGDQLTITGADGGTLVFRAQQ